MTEPYPTTPPPADDRVQQVAVAQRRMLIGLVANIVLNVASRTADGGALAVVVLAAIAVVVYTIYWVVKLCNGLGNNPVLYAIGVIIPLVGLICMFVLNSRATSFLRERGVEVGFWGAKA
jgi:hypothetical protein